MGGLQRKGRLRRSRTSFDEKANATVGPNFDIQPWLKSFVGNVGSDTAHKLLEGVGRIDWMKKDYEEDGNGELCTILLYGVPRHFAQVVLPSLRKNVLDVNPSCHVFVLSFGNTTVAEKNNVQHITGGELLLLKRGSSGMTLENKNFVQEFQCLSFLRENFPNRSPENWTYPSSIDSLALQWYSLESSWRLLEAYEDDHFQKFSRVGILRLDMNYMDRIDIITEDVAIVSSPTFEPKVPAELTIVCSTVHAMLQKYGQRIVSILLIVI